MVTKNPTDLYKENLQKYFDDMSRMAPQCFITSTTFQDECFKQVDNAVNFTTSAQQDFVKNVKTFNENVNSCIDLNKIITQSWVNTLTIK